MTSGFAMLAEQLGSSALASIGDDVWRLVYQRGYVDLDVARPYVDRSHAGILVFRRTLGDRRTLLVIDTGERLTAIAAEFAAAPAVGSAVRCIGTYNGAATWRLTVDDPFLLDAEVQFHTRSDLLAERRWLGALRDTVLTIQRHETVRREILAGQRRSLPHVVVEHSFEDMLRERSAAIRRDAARETGFAPSVVRASHAEWREQQARQQRYEALVSARLAALWADEVPRMRQRVSRNATTDTTRSALERLEVAYAQSIARGTTANAAIGWVDGLAGAPFALVGLDGPPERLDDPNRANHALRAIALLVRANSRGRMPLAV